MSESSGKAWSIEPHRHGGRNGYGKAMSQRTIPVLAGSGARYSNFFVLKQNLAKVEFELGVSLHRADRGNALRTLSATTVAMSTGTALPRCLMVSLHEP